MNYLAHVFLARETSETIVGGLLGDFVKGGAACGYPDEIRAGILLHRQIDRYTDGHAIVRASRGLIGAPRRRFAGIMVDVFYDHFLARHWARYSPTPLREFTQQIYAILAPHRATFPDRLQRVLPRMIADDWLGSYGQIQTVDAALKGIARRFKQYGRARTLECAVADLEEHYTQFENDFLVFFPDLMWCVDSGVWRQQSLDLNPMRQTGRFAVLGAK